MTRIVLPSRQPSGARLDEAGMRYYTWRGRGYDETFYSVTTMLSGGIPKYLVPWAAKLVAELAYGDVERDGKRALQRWAKEGAAYLKALREAGMKLERADETPRGLALRWLKGEPDRIRDAAMLRGQQVHTASEDLVLASVREGVRLYLVDELAGMTFDESIAPMMAGFVRWINAHRPRIIATEATVYNRSEAYAGTADLFAEFLIRGHWRRLCVDYKSGRAVYPEVALQTCAYARAEFVGGPDGVSEHPVPAVDGTAVLHLTPKGPVFKQLRYDDTVWRAFLYVREVFRWVVELAPTAIGDAIEQDLEDALTESLEEAQRATA
jgi:hypothetical protein